MRLSQRNFYSEELEKNKNNMKAQWDLIKAIINKKRGESKVNTKFRINNKIVTDPQEVADGFVDFFTDIGGKLDKIIPRSDRHPSTYITKQYQLSMFLIPTDQIEIKKTIKKLKDCAVGWDGIPAKLLKDNTETLSTILSHLINLSFTSGIFPKEMKVANLIPIFKAGDTEIIGNYRPVSLLTTISKVFERSFYTRLIKFLEEQKILYENQFGFRAKHSTYMAILILMNNAITP